MDDISTHLPFFESLSARKKDRLAGCQYIATHANDWEAFLWYAMAPKSNRLKVIITWCLELYLIEHPLLLKTILNTYLEKLPQIKDESMRRALSKVLYYYVKNKKTALTDRQIDRIITQAFDWLIEPAQVATLNFALKLLQHFQDHAPWVQEEVKAIVVQQLPTASPGYKAAAREILK